MSVHSATLHGKWPDRGFKYLPDQKAFTDPTASRKIAHAIQVSVGAKVLYRDEVVLKIGKLFYFAAERAHTRPSLGERFWSEVMTAPLWTKAKFGVTPQMVEEMANHVMLARLRGKKAGWTLKKLEDSGVSVSTAREVDRYMKGVKEVAGRRSYMYLPTLEEFETPAAENPQTQEKNVGSGEKAAAATMPQDMVNEQPVVTNSELKMNDEAAMASQPSMLANVASVSPLASAFQQTSSSHHPVENCHQDRSSEPAPIFQQTPEVPKALAEGQILSDPKTSPTQEAGAPQQTVSHPADSTTPSAPSTEQGSPYPLDATTRAAESIEQTQVLQPASIISQETQPSISSPQPASAAPSIAPSTKSIACKRKAIQYDNSATAVASANPTERQDEPDPFGQTVRTRSANIKDEELVAVKKTKVEPNVYVSQLVQVDPRDKENKGQERINRDLKSLAKKMKVLDF